MADMIISEDWIKNGTGYDLSGDGNSIELSQHVVVASMDHGGAFYLSGNDNDLTVKGTAQGSIAITLGDDPADRGNLLRVSGSGDVMGEAYGVMLRGSGQIQNDGEIRGNDLGVYLFGNADRAALVENHGSIVGWWLGVFAGTFENDVNRAPITVVNHEDGVIKGGVASIKAGEADDVVTNRGLMIGQVLLEAGNDVMDNRDGQVRAGGIHGGAGNDRILPGASAETIDGGDGVDTLDFRTLGSGVRVSLADKDGSDNIGPAKDDHLMGIERLLGSTRSADVLIGDGGANELRGYGGADRLDGGAGVDAMLGGAGNDTYVVGQAGDRVLETTSATSGTDAGGTDTVRAGVSWTLGRFVEHLTLTGTANLSGTGNGLNNRLTGNDGANTLSGGAGADVLWGGEGTDLLRGGEDGGVRDVFVFAHRSHSAVGTGRDRVENFVRGVDGIDLDRIDARASTTTNEDFTWGGTTAGAHKVWWQATAGGVILKADVTGNTAADIEVFLKGVDALGKGDVLL